MAPPPPQNIPEAVADEAAAAVVVIEAPLHIPAPSEPAASEPAAGGQAPPSLSSPLRATGTAEPAEATAQLDIQPLGSSLEVSSREPAPAPLDDRPLPAELTRHALAESWVAGLPERDANEPRRRSLAIALAIVAHAAIVAAVFGIPAMTGIGDGAASGSTLVVEIVDAAELVARRPASRPGGAPQVAVAAAADSQIASAEAARPAPPADAVRSPVPGIVVGAAAPMPEPPSPEQRTETPPTAPTEAASDTASRGAEAQDAAAAGDEAPVQTGQAEVRLAETRGRTVGTIRHAYDRIVGRALPDLSRHIAQATAEAPPPGRGEVLVEIRIGPDGRIERAGIVRSSGSIDLDRRALDDLRSFRFPASPADISGEERTYRLPIAYR